MGLAKLCARFATHDELIGLLEELEEENMRMRMALLWALGEHEAFSPPPDTKEGERPKPYYWRRELRERAGL